MATLSKRIRKEYMDGWHVFVAGGPWYSGREDGRWPVLYIPRYPTDPRPWVRVTDPGMVELRYSAGELATKPAGAVLNVVKDASGATS